MRIKLNYQISANIITREVTINNLPMIWWIFIIVINNNKNINYYNKYYIKYNLKV
jgi:hypothetical protein